MSMTVTANPGSFGRTSLAVRVLTGAAGSQPGRTVTATTETASITPTGTGSLVYGGFETGGVNALYSGASAATTVEGAADASGSNASYAALVSSAATTGGTPVTLGVAAVGGEVGPELGLCEILASGTLAEDASTPPVIPANGTGNYTGGAKTTASFTPPAGALLVAIVTNSNGLLSGTTVSDSMGLTWTRQVNAGSTVGIYTAQIAAAPSGPTPGSGVATVTGPAGSATVGQTAGTATVADATEGRATVT